MRFQIDIIGKDSFDPKLTYQKTFVFDTWHEVEVVLNTLEHFFKQLNITEINIIIVEEE
jgi:hypothetical protein